MAEEVDESGLAPVAPKGPVQRVEVVGFNMPFAELVGFMVKAAIAAIPAAIILIVLAVVAAGILTRLGIFTGI